MFLLLVLLLGLVYFGFLIDELGEKILTVLGGSVHFICQLLYQLNRLVKFLLLADAEHSVTGLVPLLDVNTRAPHHIL